MDLQKKAGGFVPVARVGLFQYIEKPWNNGDILIIFRNGLEKRLLLDRIEDKIKQINKAYSELKDLQREIVITFV